MSLKWIKLSTDLFNNRKIKQIIKMPEGKSIIIIWLHILCLAAETNDGGRIYFTKDIPFSEEMMATEFDEDVKIVRLALAVFKNYEMLDTFDELLMVSNWEKYQNVEAMDKIREQTRLRVAKHREKLLGNVTDRYTVTQRNAIDKEEDKDKDIESILPDPLDQFRVFWGNYPRKESKEKTKQWYSKNKPSDELQTRILEALETFKKTAQWQDKQFIPHPTTWLNQKRWEDEAIIAGSPKLNGKRVFPLPDWYEKYEKDLAQRTETPQSLTPEERKEVEEWFNKDEKVLSK